MQVKTGLYFLLPAKYVVLTDLCDLHKLGFIYKNRVIKPHSKYCITYNMLSWGLA